ncbi:MAG: lycopene cyclase domain-containing protein [Bacteroidia bacterium]
MGILETKYLYVILLILSVSFPLTFSWDKRFNYFKKWTAVFVGCLAMMAIFIPWDIWFAKEKVWWFNHDYTLGKDIIHLPLEEWLFFIVIPFSCIFIYESINYFIPKLMPLMLSRGLTIVSAASLGVLAILYQDGLYTFIVSIYTAVLLLVSYVKKPTWMPNFWLMYVISWIPFLLVNGGLTGLFTTNALVNYNSTEITGFRIGTIPIEDGIYSLGMLLTVTWVYEIYNSRASHSALPRLK